MTAAQRTETCRHSEVPVAPVVESRGLVVVGRLEACLTLDCESV